MNFLWAVSLLVLACTLSGCLRPATSVDRAQIYRVATLEIRRYRWHLRCE